MGILYREPRKNENESMFIPKELKHRECWYCYNSFSWPMIIWVGNEYNAWLHPGCALALCMRLIRDVHEIECKAIPKRDYTIPEGLEVSKEAIHKKG